MTGFDQATSFDLGDVRITVVERTEIEHCHDENVLVVMASKNPDALVLETKDGRCETFPIG